MRDLEDAHPANREAKKLCWQCNKRLLTTYAVIEFNGSKIMVHKTCRIDAENLLFKDKVTFQGEDCIRKIDE